MFVLAHVCWVCGPPDNLNKASRTEYSVPCIAATQRRLRDGRSCGAAVRPGHDITHSWGIHKGGNDFVRGRSAFRRQCESAIASATTPHAAA